MARGPGWGEGGGEGEGNLRGQGTARGRVDKRGRAAARARVANDSFSVSSQSRGVRVVWSVRGVGWPEWCVHAHVLLQ